MLQNIVLVTIDSLRYDHVSCYGYLRNTTPTMDRLASSGFLFQQAISNGGGTPEALPSIIASAFPPLNPSEYRTKIKRSFTLAEALKENGYRTAAFHSNPYLSRYFHYDKGFDVFYDSMDQARSGKGGELVKKLTNFCLFCLYPWSDLARGLEMVSGSLIEKAEDINQKAISWLKSSSKKFFLWIHYMDVHWPYIPPSNFRSIFFSRPINLLQSLMANRNAKWDGDRLSRYQKQRLVSLYDGSIRYLDSQIGLLMNQIGDKLSNTAIIITSDHGDEFWDHGNFGHRVSLYDEIIRVPLIISIPENKRISLREQVSHLDLAPTIVDLLGLNPVESFHGHSLLSSKGYEYKEKSGIISVALDVQTGIRKLSYRTECRKYIRTENIDDRALVLKRELYDLLSDPQELRNQEQTGVAKMLEFDSRLEKMVYENQEKKRISEIVKRLRKVRVPEN